MGREYGREGNVKESKMKINKNSRDTNYEEGDVKGTLRGEERVRASGGRAHSGGK